MTDSMNEFRVSLVLASLDIRGLSRAPYAAALLLADGYSTPTLDYLAGFSSGTDDRALSPLIRTAGIELGLPDIDAPGGPLALAQLTAGLIAEGAIEPRRGAALIWNRILRQTVAADQDKALIFEGLSAEWDESEDRQSVERRIVEVASKFSKAEW